MFEQTVTGDLFSTTNPRESSQRGHEFLRLKVTGDCPQKLLFDKTEVFTSEGVT